ncbi:glycosyltransferase family 4 protein [Zunongwangia sp. H14]|uniref:glycosyltransferase family 4 protein n=1 Tax=Zunongwangia sp. H14 TaxID=3240792 RepID=UPI003562F932
MRLLFYAHSSTIYGANVSLVNLISGIMRHHPETFVHVIIPSEEPIGSLLKKNKIGYSVIPHLYWSYNFEVAEKHRRSSNSVFKIWYLKNKWEKKIKNLLYRRRHLAMVKELNPDLIYVNSSLAPMGAMMAKKLNVPFLWHHRETIEEPVYGFMLEDRQQFSHYFRHAALHIYTSQFLHEFYKKEFGTHRFKIAYNGVAFKDENLGFSRPDFVKIKFGVVGRINSQKNQKEVLEIFRELLKDYKQKMELILIGEGEKLYLEKIIPKNTGVNYLGFLPKNEIYQHFDFLIVNSKNEAFGRTVAEANAAGIPVLGRFSGAFPEIIVPGKNGYLYEDAKGLKKAILDLAEGITPATYASLSSSSREHFEENFTIEQYSEAIWTALKKVVS